MDLTQFTVQPLTPIVGSVKDLNATWLRDYIYTVTITILQVDLQHTNT